MKEDWRNKPKNTGKHQNTDRQDKEDFSQDPPEDVCPSSYLDFIPVKLFSNFWPPKAVREYIHAFSGHQTSGSLLQKP